jgi:hypothetical protein
MRSIPPSLRAVSLLYHYRTTKRYQRESGFCFNKHISRAIAVKSKQSSEKGEIVMTIKLERRFGEIQADYDDLQKMVTGQAENAVIQERLMQLEAKQADLKKTLLHVIVLCKRREELQAVLPSRSRR